MNLDKEFTNENDRRVATSNDIRRLIDQNQGVCNTVQSLVATVNSHETRITVLEVRSAIGNKEMEEIKTNGSETLKVLSEHTKQEDKDRQRLLLAIISTLFAVLGGIGMIVAPKFFQ